MTGSGKRKVSARAAAAAIDDAIHGLSGPDR